MTLTNDSGWASGKHDVALDEAALHAVDRSTPTKAPTRGAELKLLRQSVCDRLERAFSGSESEVLKARALTLINHSCDSLFELESAAKAALESPLTHSDFIDREREVQFTHRRVTGELSAQLNFLPSTKSEHDVVWNQRIDTINEILNDLSICADYLADLVPRTKRSFLVQHASQLLCGDIVKLDSEKYMVRTIKHNAVSDVVPVIKLGSDGGAYETTLSDRELSRVLEPAVAIRCVSPRAIEGELGRTIENIASAGPLQRGDIILCLEPSSEKMIRRVELLDDELSARQEERETSVISYQQRHRQTHTVELSDLLTELDKLPASACVLRKLLPTSHRAEVVQAEAFSSPSFDWFKQYRPEYFEATKETRSTFELRSGDVIEQKDGDRAIICTTKDGGLELISLTAAGVKRSALNSNQLDDTARSDTIIRAIEPSLVRGVFEGKPLAAPEWHVLHAGDMIFHPDGSREEILALRPVPIKGRTHQDVDSILYDDKGVHYRENVRRTDAELTGPSKPLVVGKAAYSVIHPAPEKDRTVYPGVLNNSFKVLDQLTQRITERLSALALRASDKAVEDLMRKRARNGQAASQDISVDPRFEDLLKMQKDAHLTLLRTNRALKNAISASFVDAVGVPRVSTDSLVTSILAKHADQAESLEELTKIWDEIIDSFDQNLTGDALLIFTRLGYNLKNTSHELRSQAKLIQNLYGSLAQSNTAFTRIESSESISAETLQEVASLVNQAQARKDPKKAGIIVDNYYTPEYLLKMLQAGAKLITLQEPHEETSRTTGFIFYYEPGKIPASALGVADEARHDRESAYVDLLLVSPNASVGAAQKLLDAKTTCLQHTDALYSYGEVMHQNARSFGVLIQNGYSPELANDIQTHASDGEAIRWIPMRAVEHAYEREVFLPHSGIVRETLKRGFQLQSETEVLPIAPPSEKEWRPVEQLVSKYVTDNERPVFVRFSAGALNMSVKDYSASRKVIEDGTSGLSVFYSWGATEMLTLVDGEVSGRVRLGFQETMEIVGKRANSQAVAAGVNVYDPQVEEIVSFSNFMNGDPVVVVGRDGNVITIEDSQVQNRFRFEASRSDKKVPFYQVEVFRSFEMGRLMQKIASEQGKACPRLGIFMNGGGTIGREIELMAEAAFKNPQCGIHVILIDKSGDGSSTQKFIDDPAWEQRHLERARELGVDPYVHIIRYPSHLELPEEERRAVQTEALRTLLASFGAVQTDEISLETPDSLEAQTFAFSRVRT